MTAGADRARLAKLRERTLWSVLSETADRAPEAEAIVAVDDDGAVQRLSYGELRDRARRLSTGLAAVGVRRGDRVALLMTNLPEFVTTYYAAMRLGAVLVPINTRLIGREVAYILGQSGARHLVMLDRFRRFDFTEMLARLRPELPDLRTVTVLARDGAPSSGAFDFATLEAGRADGVAIADALEAEVRPDDLALIKYTSGSTGFPKGAMLEQGGLFANAVIHSERLEIDRHDRWLTGIALFHAGGSVWGLLTTLVRGATLVFTETFDAERGLEVAARERCTAIFGVAAMIRDFASVLRTRDLDLSALRHMGGSVDPALAAELRERIPSLRTTINAFGLTEAYATCSCVGPRDSPEIQATTCGPVYRGLECRVVDPVSGDEVVTGKIGEAQLRGLVMRGYWDKPEETAEAIDPDGWLRTGDLVTKDEDGYLRYVGRIKTMLKVGGENVAVEEVENVILEHAAVEHCALVGVADAHKDQVGWAYVELHAGARAGEAELNAWCAERLAAFKVPERWVFMDALPRTGSGKVDRPTIERLAAGVVAAA